MKLKLVLFMFSAILVAVGGAFATKSQNTVRLVPIFYEDNGACLAGTVLSTDLCEIGSIESCPEDVIETADTRQIFASEGNGVECAQPYQELPQR